MSARTRLNTALTVGVAAAALVAGLLTLPAAAAGVPSAAGDQESSTVDDLRIVSAGPAASGEGEPGETVLLVAPPGRPVARPDGVAPDAPAAEVARAHLEDVAPLIGVDTDALRADPAPVALEGTGTGSASSGATELGSVARFTQVVGGVPVYGSSVVVSLDEDGGLQSVGSGTATEPAGSAPRLSFTVAAPAARSAALGAAATYLRVPQAALTAGTPTRYVYDPALFDESGNLVPVWRVKAGVPRSASSAEVLISARDASVVAISGGTAQLRRGVCDAYTVGTEIVNGQVRQYDASFTDDSAYGWCGEQQTSVRYRDTNKDGRLTSADAVLSLSVPYARLEGQAPTGAGEVDAAYDALGHSADLYAQLGVDLTDSIAPTAASIDVPGTSTTRTLAGIVNYCDPVESFYTFPFSYQRAENAARAYCPYANAFWYDLDSDWVRGDGRYPGGQMFIGRGLAASEDVIGHELTHGVTAQVSGLVYRGQPGAINESMSDVFGQLSQVYAAPGTDSAWLIGEKINAPRLKGAIRSMSNPASTTLPEGGPQPDRMTSGYWDRDPLGQDSGGVHTNSGVGNKAAWLIANGGRFNGTTVRRLDTTHAIGSREATLKTARLYWATQRLLPSNASYRTLGFTLFQACQQLVAARTPGFVASDCTQSVAPAAAATQMTTTKVTSTVSKTSLTYGATVKVSAKVTDARGASVGATSLALQHRVAGTTTWRTIATGRTSASAKRWTIKPAATARYRVVALATGGAAASPSATKQTKVKARVSRKVRDSSIRLGKRIKVTGKVSPNARGKVRLQQRVNGRWRTVKKVRLSTKSTYVLRYRPRSSVDRTYRVYRPAVTRNLAGTSAKFRIRVR